MAVGPAPFKSAWAFMRGRGITNNLFMLRTEVELPKASTFIWKNFWFGTDFSGDALTQSLTDTVGSSSGGGGSGWFGGE